MKQSILVVDDDISIRKSLKFLLDGEGYHSITVSDGTKALEKLSEVHISAVLLDIKMPGMDGLVTLEKIRDRHNYLTVIMLSAIGDTKTAVKAIKLGADDYICKPYNKDELLILLEKNLNLKNDKLEIDHIKSDLERINKSKTIISQSQSMQKVFNLIEKASKNNITVLITGETGTGKELVACQLHQKSSRQKKPFISVNCAAIQKELLESELFGHEKGAFTGAYKQKLGKIEVANEGTIFFDEISSLPLELQPKMLRVLQEKTFERVGGTVSIPANARFIFATNEDLKDMVKKGNFREDLYYRINVFPIYIPPLRERKEDISLLVNHFIQKFCIEQRKNLFKLDPDVLEYFLQHAWKGNVRQLENEIERIVTLAENDQEIITTEFLSHDILDKEGDEILEAEGMLNDAIKTLEIKMIRSALGKFKGNKTKAAEYLGISRRGFHKKLDRFGLTKTNML